jgi:hypothetical protein
VSERRFPLEAAAVRPLRGPDWLTEHDRRATCCRRALQGDRNDPSASVLELHVIQHEGKMLLRARALDPDRDLIDTVGIDVGCREWPWRRLLTDVADLLRRELHTVQRSDTEVVGSFRAVAAGTRQSLPLEDPDGVEAGTESTGNGHRSANLERHTLQLDGLRRRRRRLDGGTDELR